MTKLICDISMSLDGFVAGPNPSLEHPLGSVIHQYLKAGLLDELQIHLAPVLLGDGTLLFDRLGTGPVQLEAVRVIASPFVTHLRFQPRQTGGTQ